MVAARKFGPMERAYSAKLSRKPSRVSMLECGFLEQSVGTTVVVLETNNNKKR